MADAASDTFDSLSRAIQAECWRMNGSEYRLIQLIQRMERLKPWNGAIPSCAHWLNWACELDLVTAREKVRVAHALETLPLIEEKFRSRELSYSKVRAITRVASWENEAELTALAENNTAAHVEKLVRARRQAERLAEPGAAFDAWRQRYFNCQTLENGALHFEGQLPADQGALLLKALDRAMEWLSHETTEPFAERRGATEENAHHHAHCCASTPCDPPPDDPQHSAPTRRTREAPLPDEVTPATDSPTVRRADALAALAERFLALPPSNDAGLNTADRFQVTVHASAEALLEFAEINPADPPQIEDGAGVAADTLRRLCCDTALVRILETGAGEPLDVGRKTRVIPAAIRRALKRRDGGCRFPGCTNTRFVDGHHIHHWADGGVTSLENLVSVCRHHHTLLHEGGYYVVKDGAAFIFCRGDGLVIPSVAPHRRVEGATRRSYRADQSPHAIGLATPAREARSCG